MPKKTEEKPKTAKKAPKIEALNSSEFAVIATGGKQYKVSVGEILSIEKMKGEFKEGDKLTFDKVLLVDDGSNTTIGTPYIDGANVLAELVEIGRAAKVNVVKYKQKSRYFKKSGHRQPFFRVKITALK
ncbi:MAG: 50S ribosomal protein L21 [Patescibacteria group bacterium]